MIRQLSKNWQTRVEISHLIWSKDLSGLSGFFRQLRSKSCFKMSGLSGFWTVYLKKKRSKNRARFERFWAVYLKNRSKTAQDLIIQSRPQRDSNPQSSAPKSDAFSVSLCGLAASLIFAVFVLLNMFNVLDMHNKYTGQKCCFWALFGKLLHWMNVFVHGRPWMNVFFRVLQRRETLSLGPRPGKTAQKPLKNRSNLAWKTVQKSPQEMSGFWAVF